MPKFVLEQNLLGLLVQSTIGGQPNPFKEAIEFLDKTEGSWDRDNTRETRNTLEDLQLAFASPPPAGRRWYQSKYFEHSFLTMEQIVQAYGLFQATGLWGELIGYDAFVMIPTADYESPTPDYLPLSTADGGGQKPWSQWRNIPGTAEHHPVEGGWLIPLHPDNNRPVAGWVLARLFADGFTIYPLGSQPAFLTVETEPEPEPDPEP